MTEAQVKTAYPGPFRVPAPEEKLSYVDSRATLAAPYATGEFNFEARFYFDNASHLLSRVSLEAADPSQCNLINQGLFEKYGQVVKDSSMSGLTVQEWRDTKNNNHIIFVGFLVGSGFEKCSVTYGGLSAGNNSGL